MGTSASPAKPVNITNEHSHPTKGTVQYYDPTLYNQLKSTHPFPATRNTGLPPLIVPRDRAGNRLAIIRGWDLAVAELMTQVICVLHCGPSKDYVLGGLRQYLMGLGIVC